MRLSAMTLLAIALVCLAACRTEDKPALERGSLTLAPPPPPIYLGSCDVIDDLESWLQTVQFQQRDFIELMTAAPERDAAGLYDDVERMAALRDRIVAEPAPDCAVEAHNALIAAMGGIVDDFVRVVNGDDVDLQRVIDDGAAAVDAAVALQSPLLERLDNLFRNPTPAP
jgi:hypothetical protein